MTFPAESLVGRLARRCASKCAWTGGLPVEAEVRQAFPEEPAYGSSLQMEEALFSRLSVDKDPWVAEELELALRG